MVPVVRVEVRSKVPGAAGDGLPAVLVELVSERTTVAELIRRTVEEQIRLLAWDRARCRAALDRQYLSPDDIRAQAGTGVVRMPAPRRDALDPAEEVARACRAFEGKAFAVFLGGRQAERLEEEVVVRLGEPVVFLRLVPLVGG